MGELSYPFASRMVVALLAAGISACAGSATAPVQANPAPVPGPPSAGARQSDLQAIAKAQADSIRLPYTEADIHFMSGMISHHAQAITMSNWAVTHDAGPSIKTLALRIINAQQDEINLMQQWLKDRRQPIPEADPAGMKMTMNGTEHVMLMPGMLTADQLTRLDKARGLEFDRLFLTYMIQHHQGATAMAQKLFNTYGAAQDELIFKFASDVNVDQTTEIARMERMLNALPAGRAP